MKPLIVLLLSFILSNVILFLFKKEVDYALTARISMSIMLLFTAIGHFVYTKGMSLMLPEFIPFKENVVYLTGIIEILFAVGLLIPNLIGITGWALILFLLLMLPANIYAALSNVNYQKGTFDGHGINYLWFRIPLQVLFIAWTYISSIRF